MRTKTLLIAPTHSAYDSAECVAAMRLKMNCIKLYLNFEIKFNLLKVCDINVVIELERE